MADPNRWRIEGVLIHKGTGGSDPSRWGYSLFQPGYVQVPMATSDSWDHLVRLIMLCGLMDVYATTDKRAYLLNGPVIGEQW